MLLTPFFARPGYLPLLTVHKTSGSTNSASALAPEGRFQLTAGDPKTFTKQHESGMTLTLRFCGDCGSALWKNCKGWLLSRLARSTTQASWTRLPRSRTVYLVPSQMAARAPGGHADAETAGTLGS